MEKILSFFTIITLLSACTATSKLSKSELRYAEGDDLIYEIRAKDDDGDDVKYEIELNINGVEDEYVSFDWEVFAERSGTIAMNENAIENATTLSFFDETGYSSFKDKTTIWLSRTVLKKLKASEKVEIGLNEKKFVFHQTGTETFNFGIEKNYYLPVIIVANADNSVEMWIVDDEKNPILVQMTMKDFRMDLKDYKLFQ